MNKRYALFGAGGHALEVEMQMLDNLPKSIKIDMFVVDDELASSEETWATPLSSIDPSEYKIMVAVGCSTARRRITTRLSGMGFEFFSFVHPLASVAPNFTVGRGSFVGAYCFVGPNVVIGDHALLNRAAHVGHDCRIGRCFSAMPGAIVSGNVTIGDDVYLGTNSSVRERVNIGNEVTLGMGAALVGDADFGTWVGVPAGRLLR